MPPEDKGIQMPRKKQTEGKSLKEPKTSGATDVSAPEAGQSEKRIIGAHVEDVPFAEIIQEMESGDERVNVPYFAEADEIPVSIPALDHDALDAAIQGARAIVQPAHDKPAHSSMIAYEQPALITIPGRADFPAEIAPPPLIVLAAGTMLVFLLAFA
jgi:hypothetical protein